MENKRLKVIVFTSPSCSWCSRVKQYLRKNKIKFKEVDISKKPSAAKDVQKKTGQMGVPVTLINNRPVVGFNKPKLDKLIGLK